MAELEPENKNFARFRVAGLEHISIKDADRAVLLSRSCSSMQSIQFLVTAGNPSYLYGVEICYTEETQLNKNILKQTIKFIERILLISMIRLDEAIPELRVLYVPRGKKINTAVIKEHTQAEGRATLRTSYDLQSFERVIQNEMMIWRDSDGLVSEDFDLLMAIANVGDVTSRYLLGYKMLMDLVKELDGARGVTQKQVTNFIFNRYNPAQPQYVFTIATMPARRRGESFDEDELTWYRNVLSHPTIEEEQSVIKGLKSDATFQRLLKKENQVLLFAIREKFNRKRYPRH